MPANFKISATARNKAVDGIVDLVDGGAGAGKVEIRTGAPPTNPSDADSGTLLATLPMSDPAFGNGGATVTGRADANSITSDTSADATGDAGHFRVKDSDNNVIFQGTAGESADTPDLLFDDKSIVTGGTVAISSFQVLMPEQ